jgi:hypothetical protein
MVMTNRMMLNSEGSSGSKNMITSLLILVVLRQIGNDLVDFTTFRAEGGKLNLDLHDDPFSIPSTIILA